MDEGLGHTHAMDYRSEEEYFERERERESCSLSFSQPHTAFTPPCKSSQTVRAKPKRASETEGRSAAPPDREREHGQEEENKPPSREKGRESDHEKNIQHVQNKTRKT